MERGSGAGDSKGSRISVRLKICDLLMPHVSWLVSVRGDRTERGNPSPWLCVYETQPAAGAAAQ